ncbi:MAG: S1 RNA-binding domain-containing protein [Coleofasciculaceae cyanobacterium SM2_1_6]|nr:S1 RNA-binding domain-containing protein [Coleofasciculaceae cyanobacterium SM2_1_6]
MTSQSTNSPNNSQRTTASFSTEDFAKALIKHDYDFKRGQTVRGIIHTHERDGAYVDVGGKSLAFVPLDEAALVPIRDISSILPLDAEIDFLIIREQNEEGQVTLSRRQLELRLAWERLLEIQANNVTVQVRVTGFNKGGVTVDVESLRGFIPRSHLTHRDEMESLVGNTITATFLEVNPKESKLILSQRQASHSAALSQLQTGQLVFGKVTGVRPFGVFVDLEGVTGLLHIKQVSQKFIENLPGIFETGQELKAVIIEIDDVKKRISLSTRILESYPGEMLEKREEVMATAEARLAKAQQKLFGTAPLEPRESAPAPTPEAEVTPEPAVAPEITPEVAPEVVAEEPVVAAEKLEEAIPAAPEVVSEPVTNITTAAVSPALESTVPAMETTPVEV